MIWYSLVSMGNWEIPWLHKVSGSDIDQHVPGDTLNASGVSRLNELNSIMHVQIGDGASKPKPNHRKGKWCKRKMEKVPRMKMQIEFQGNNLQHLTTSCHWTAASKVSLQLGQSAQAWMSLIRWWKVAISSCDRHPECHLVTAVQIFW